MKHIKNLVNSNLFLLIPLVFLPYHYEQVKVKLFFLLCSIFVLYLVIKTKGIIKLHNFQALFLFWVIVLFITSLQGIHPMFSIIGGSYRHQGILFFLGLWILSLLPTKSKHIFRILLIVGVVESIFLFFNQLGTMGEVNASASLIALSSISIFDDTTNKKIRKGLFLLFFLAIFISGSKIALLILMFIAACATLQKKFLVMPLLFVCIGLGVLTVQHSNIPNSMENRNQIWEMSIEAIKTRPLFGFGLESGEEIFDQQFAKRQIYLKENMVDRAHNLFLDVMLWSGIVGLGVFVVWLLMVLKNSYKNNYLVYVLIWGLVLFSFFQPLIIAHWLLLSFPYQKLSKL